MLLDPTAPKALRTCIEEAVKKHTLPPAAKLDDVDRVLLEFRPSKLP